MNYCLGAKPAQIRDGMPSLNKLKMMSRVAPPRCIRGHIDVQPVLGYNDQIGDCTAVGLLNSARALSALNGSKLVCKDEDAVAFYEKSCGYSPSEPYTDQGGIEVDVLTYAAHNGVIMGNYPYFPLWGSLDYKSKNSLAMCCLGLGSVYLGLQLANADQAQVGFTFDTATEGDQTPGSWGGHCAVLWDYEGLGDTDIVHILTWGKIQRATWRWLESRLMEAHGILWPQLAGAPGGFLSQDNFNKVRDENLEFLSGESF